MSTKCANNECANDSFRSLKKLRYKLASDAISNDFRKLLTGSSRDATEIPYVVLSIMAPMRLRIALSFKYLVALAGWNVDNAQSKVLSKFDRVLESIY